MKTTMFIEDRRQSKEDKSKGKTLASSMEGQGRENGEGLLKKVAFGLHLQAIQGLREAEEIKEDILEMGTSLCKGINMVDRVLQEKNKEKINQAGLQIV